MDIRNKAFAFEQLCAKMLESNGINIKTVDEANEINHFDIVCYDNEHCIDIPKLIIEVKFYRSTFKYPIFNNAIISIKKLARSKFSNVKIAFFVNQILLPEQKAEIENNQQIIIVDLEDIVALSNGNSYLLGELQKINEDVIPTPVNTAADILLRLNLSSGTKKKTYDENELAQADILKNKLQTIKYGRNDWRNYEQICIDILKYLFGEVLNGWHEQRTTSNRYNRYDLICRIYGKDGLWDFIVNGLNSRYVLFEFKNYRKGISQNEIFTTERYLFRKAKRTTCFIISRLKEQASALEARQGVLREQGKLIINLVDHDLLEMLEMRKNGDDPSDYLFDIIDDFLIKLTR